MDLIDSHLTFNQIFNHQKFEEFQQFQEFQDLDDLDGVDDLEDPVRSKLHQNLPAEPIQSQDPPHHPTSFLNQNLPLDPTLQIDPQLHHLTHHSQLFNYNLKSHFIDLSSKISSFSSFNHFNHQNPINHKFNQHFDPFQSSIIKNSHQSAQNPIHSSSHLLHHDLQSSKSNSIHFHQQDTFEYQNNHLKSSQDAPIDPQLELEACLIEASSIPVPQNLDLSIMSSNHISSFKSKLKSSAKIKSKRPSNRPKKLTKKSQKSLKLNSDIPACFAYETIKPQISSSQAPHLNQLDPIIENQDYQPYKDKTLVTSQASLNPTLVKTKRKIQKNKNPKRRQRPSSSISAILISDHQDIRVSSSTKTQSNISKTDFTSSSLDPLIYSSLNTIDLDSFFEPHTNFKHSTTSKLQHDSDFSETNEQLSPQELTLQNFPAQINSSNPTTSFSNQAHLDPHESVVPQLLASSLPQLLPHPKIILEDKPQNPVDDLIEESKDVLPKTYDPDQFRSCNRMYWTKEEEELLLKEVELNWHKYDCMAQIMKRHGPMGTISKMFADRTGVSLKDKAVNISSKWYREGTELSESRKRAFARFRPKQLRGKPRYQLPGMLDNNSDQTHNALINSFKFNDHDYCSFELFKVENKI
ncbi:hypothetical protein O181_033734 [Austropuccinia psidii MF-1]|uniref:Myb-like domain-containing protein n=1 Tax=Austropuccinia psidii MF-1 TaxID=1389203 RepID=A0A9Q3H8U6_9BASI|nr:hypothetical protein [Austropuccinia psidii MF-1]